MKRFSGILFAVVLVFSVAVVLPARVAGADLAWVEHNISSDFGWAKCVYATDVDGDGDIDILGAAQAADDITWWENDGSENFTEHTIAGSFDGAISVYATDVDSDGDIDVLGAAAGADDITWWENDGSENFTEHTIAGNFNRARNVYATDVDGDGDIDVLGAANDTMTSAANDINWWENDGSENFTEHTITNSLHDARSVYATDVDGDGDTDVLGAGGRIVWWENDGSENFTEHSWFFNGAQSVYATDVDGDSDVDILGGGSGLPSETAWWENDGYQNFSKHNIASGFGAASIYATDVDGDGDVDVLAAENKSIYADDITWWENDGSENFTEHTIKSDFGGARGVYATDVDGDGDVDVLGAGGSNIAWWENRGTPPSEVWVDDGWVGSSPGDPVDGHIFDTDAFATIQDGIDAVASPGTVHVADGLYVENITLKDGVQLLGAGADITTIDGGGVSSVVRAIDVGSETVLDGFTITNGIASSGGGMYNESASLIITNCVFSGNSARYDGGGICNYRWCSLTVINCIFSNNSASVGIIGGDGGGMHNGNSSATVTNCTFYNNSASYGGGICNEYSSATVTNSILWSNSDDLYVSWGSDCTVIYSNIKDGDPGTGNISTPPMFVDPAGGDYHLELGSPCIDKGTNVGAPTEDIEGNPRPIDGDGDGTATTDMGAYEYVPIPPIADFSAEPTAGVAPLAVEFTDKSTGDITSCLWDFGDGSTSDEENPSHSYSMAGIYTVSLDVSGPSGADTETKEGYIIVYEQEEVTIDFDPDTLNLKSKGKVVTVYIELPEGYDVEKTDVSTVMLNSIVPALAHPTDVGDYDSDGVLDLMVKFDRSNVQDVLEPGNEVEVTVSGQLTDGTSFEGADTIRVIEKEKK